ncbi:MAG: 2-dehydropantoate 2-reductase [Idiomarina sp.]
MISSDINWWVVGKGALGSLIAAKLVAADQQVLIKLRDSDKALQRQFTFVDATQKPLQSSLLDIPVAPANSAAPQVIVAAIKAYDVMAFIENYRTASWGLQAITPPQLILSYNGMLENEAQLVEGLPVRHLVTTQAAYTETNYVTHSGLGQSWLAANSNSALDAVFSNAFPPLQVVTDIQHRRWLKLAINSVINPLTAVHECLNGHLSEPQFTDQIQQLCTEFCAIAAAAGYAFEVKAISELVFEVIQQTAANHSSMRQDIRNNRKTEIDYLNGFLVRMAAKHNVKATAHEQLWHQLTQ